MRYRALSAAGDYQFGRPGLFLVNTPEAVAQAVKTRLGLVSGEWFVDLESGTPYPDKVQGMGTRDTRDAVLKTRILDTPGVAELINYHSTLNPDRSFVVTAFITTIYGVSQITTQV